MKTLTGTEELGGGVMRLKVCADTMQVCNDVTINVCINVSLSLCV